MMRQILTRILVIARDTGDEEDDSDWRQGWTRFAMQLQGSHEFPGPVEDGNGNLDAVEEWIDSSVEAFASRAGIFARFVQPVSGGGNS